MSDGTDQHPAEKAYDETLDDLAKVMDDHKLEAAESAAEMMKMRWKKYGPEGDDGE